MPQVTVTAADGQVHIASDVPGEQVLMLLTQAAEMVRVQVVAKAVADLSPRVTIEDESALPRGTNGGMPPGSHGIRGGDANFRIGRAQSGS